MKRCKLFALVLTVSLGIPAAAQLPAPALESLEGVALSPERLPDGRPNLTGFWVPPGGLLEVYRGPSGVTGLPAGPNNVPRVRRDIPEMKSPYKERYEQVVARAAAAELGSSTALCLPQGMPAMMGAIYGLEILQTPKIIAITSEWQAFTRRVWMDLKEHPPADELDATYAGHSIGHWEGDTLVVDTVGIREDVPLDSTRIPHSPNAHLIERFTQFSPGVLVNDITIEDPEVFVTPWKYRYLYVYKPDLRLREYVCLENNRNVGPDGSAVFE